MLYMKGQSRKIKTHNAFSRNWFIIASATPGEVSDPRRLRPMYLFSLSLTTRAWLLLPMKYSYPPRQSGMGPTSTKKYPLQVYSDPFYLRQNRYVATANRGISIALRRFSSWIYHPRSMCQSISKTTRLSTAALIFFHIVFLSHRLRYTQKQQYLPFMYIVLGWIRVYHRNWIRDAGSFIFTECFKVIPTDPFSE